MTAYLNDLDARLCRSVSEALGIDPALVSIAEHRPATGEWAGSGATVPVFRFPAASTAAAAALGLTAEAS